jgi:hypothetical protein
VGDMERAVHSGKMKFVRSHRPSWDS